MHSLKRSQLKHSSLHDYSYPNITTVFPLPVLVLGNSPPDFGSVNTSVVPYKVEKSNQEISEMHLFTIPHI